jgi:nucleotide-binding universal stress UspA family protein
MKPILVPTDFSACAANALQYAFEIAEHTGQFLKVLYVVYPSDGVNNNMYDAFFIDTYVEERTAGLKDWVKPLQEKYPNTAVTCECTVGLPISTICQSAEDMDAGLIVMGTTGASGLSGVLMGSIAGGVASNSKVPVMTVPTQAQYQPNGMFAFATDFKKPLSAKAIQCLQDILDIEHNGMAIVHVINGDKEQRDQKQEQALTQALGNIPHDFHYLHAGDIADGVHVFIESTDCNGLITVAHEHGLFYQLFRKSVSKTLAQHALVPTLVLHEK